MKNIVIDNAVYNAIDVRITELPISPEKILEGLKAKR
jgi:CO/xanthine dehydrogenase Mo-binding subunit